MSNQESEKSNRIPVINAGRALQSLRDSGHSLPTALGEVVDNSVEAEANNIAIHLEESHNSRGKKHVHRIVISDDGLGMDENTLHHYPVVGFSTRYMQTDTIGKYGVGAKLAALNFGRRFDVWSRTDPDQPWRHVYFDLDEAIAVEETGEQALINEPTEEPVPSDLEEFLPEGAGTVLVWSNVDRLEEGRMAEDFNSLRLELEKELSRLFRYFLDAGISISINGKKLIPFDPLMLMTEDWSDIVLNKHLGKQAKRDGDKWSDKQFSATILADENIKVGNSEARLRITLYPREVTRTRYLGGDSLAKELRVANSEGLISFVRKGREVSYTIVPKVLPSGIRDLDRFIGIEVSFNPELDDYFGIRNVKRGVEPHGDLRNRIRELLAKFIKPARVRIQEAWSEVEKEDKDTVGEHGNVAGAVSDVNKTMPSGPKKEETTEGHLERALDELAKDVGYDKEEDKKQYLDTIKKLPFVIESVDFPGREFITTDHISNKVIIRLNTRHPFYRELWEPIKNIAERDAGSVSGTEAVKTAQRTIEALTLLVIAYSKAESMHQNPHEQYGDLKSFWGQFLATLMTQVKGVF